MTKYLLHLEKPYALFNRNAGKGVTELMGSELDTRLFGYLFTHPAYVLVPQWLVTPDASEKMECLLVQPLPVIQITLQNIAELMMHGDVSVLGSLAVSDQNGPGVQIEIHEFKVEQFLASQASVEECGDDGVVPCPLEMVFPVAVEGGVKYSLRFFVCEAAGKGLGLFRQSDFQHRVVLHAALFDAPPEKLLEVFVVVHVVPIRPLVFLFPLPEELPQKIHGHFAKPCSICPSQESPKKASHGMHRHGAQTLLDGAVSSCPKITCASLSDLISFVDASNRWKTKREIVDTAAFSKRKTTEAFSWC